MVLNLPTPLTPETEILAEIKSWDNLVGNAPIRGGFTGDSMLFHGAKTLEGGTIARAQNKMYARKPVTGCTVMPAFLHLSADYAVDTPYPGGNAAKGLEPFEPLKVGVPSKQYNGVGLGLQATTQSAGQERYLAKAASSHGHWYRPQTTGATATVHVDGVQKLSSSIPKGVWAESRVLTPGTKPESRIKFVGGSYDYDGMVIYRGTENRGWQYWDMSHSGFGSERFVDSSNGSSAWADQIPAIGEFKFHANFLGTNDSGMGLTLRTQYARAWAQLVRAKSPNAIIIFARPQKPGAWSQAEWDEVLQAYAQVASEMRKVWVIDIAKYMPRDENQQIDPLHLNELGHEKQATVFHNYLTGVYAAAGGGTGGGTGEDTAGPVISNRFPGAGVAVSSGGTQDFTFDITDESAIASMAIVGSDGRIIGGKAPELISGTKCGLLGVPWASLSNDPTDSSSNPITTWRVAARDEFGNLTTTDSRAITVARNASTAPTAPTITRVLPTVGKAWVPNEPIDYVVTHPDGVSSVILYTGGDQPQSFAELTQQAGDHWTGNVDLSKIVEGATQFQVRAVTAGTTPVTGIAPWAPFTIASGSSTPISSTITSPEPNAVITEVMTVRVTYTGPELRSMELCANGGTEPFGILSPLGGTQWGVDIAGTALPAGIVTIRLKFTPIVGDVSYSGPRGIKAQISVGTKQGVLADATTGALGPKTEAWIRSLGTTGGTGSGDVNADRLDTAVFAPLDMGENRIITIGGLGDSIMYPTDAWFVKGWAGYATIKAPERPVTCRTWDSTSSTLGAAVTVQGAASGGGGGGGSTASQVVFSDNLNRGGTGTATELVGSTPQVGQKWEGPTGVWRTFNNVVAEPVPGVAPTLDNPVYAKLAAVTVAADHKITRAVRFTTSTTDGTTTLIGGATKSNLDGTQIRVTGSSSGTAVATLEVVVSGTARVVATFPAGTVLDATNDQLKAVVIELAGTTLKGSLANQSQTAVAVQGTLTANEVTSLVGWDRVAIRSNDLRAREDLIVAVGTVSTSASGGTGSLPAIALINGGAPGMTLTYHKTRIKAIFPTRPDAVMISAGMNNEAQTPADYVAELQAIEAAVEAEYPGMAYFYVPQNPRYTASDGAPASRIPDHAARQQAGRGYARTKGWQVIDLFSDYTQQTDRGASWVEAADGKHPNTLGKIAMTNRTVAELKTLSTRI